jgi:hypothetical protein
MTRRNKPASIGLASAIEAEDRFASSPAGMSETARALRRRAQQMADSRDRELMLCMAMQLERRADEIASQQKPRRR